MNNTPEHPATAFTDTLPGFNGERTDPVLGGYHLGNGYRLYSPALRRFTAPDSMSPFGQGGINPYAYCEGDPINNTDPTGHIAPGIYRRILITAGHLAEDVAEAGDPEAEAEDSALGVGRAINAGERAAGNNSAAGAVHQNTPRSRSRSRSPLSGRAETPTNWMPREGGVWRVPAGDTALQDAAAAQPRGRQKLSAMHGNDLATELAKQAGWYHRGKVGEQEYDVIFNPVNRDPTPRHRKPLSYASPVRERSSYNWAQTRGRLGYYRVVYPHFDQPVRIKNIADAALQLNEGGLSGIYFARKYEPWYSPLVKPLAFVTGGTNIACIAQCHPEWCRGRYSVLVSRVNPEDAPDNPEVWAERQHYG